MRTETDREILLAASGLLVGEEAEPMRCPFCQADHEDKFHVKRIQEGLLYNCLRASCGARGFIGTQPGAVVEHKEPLRTDRRRRPYRGKLLSLSPQDIEFFQDTWEVFPWGIRVTERDEYALPLMSPKAYIRGWVVRQPRWKGREAPRSGFLGAPKALTYKDTASDPTLSWAIGTHSQSLDLIEGGGQIVLVEDYISALKISQCGSNAIGVALNGAHLTYEGAEEIARMRPQMVHVWLDPDATSKTYDIQRSHGLMFNYCSVMTSSFDPKDETMDTIREAMENAGW